MMSPAPGLATAPTQRSGVRQLILDNGLHAVWEADGRQPLVAIEARIKGGLRGEGRYVGSGITHFIEHMLFKGTTSRPPGTIEQEIRGYGGTINAFTSFDVTGVSLFVEARYLPQALDLLADILQHAVFDPKEFEKERAVIISEMHMNLDDPDRRIHQVFWGRHLLEHPYRHPVIGYQPVFERLTVKDLSDLYVAQYHPQNVTLAIAGDVGGADLPQLLEKTFGAWPRGPVDPSQLLVPLEPPSASAKEQAIELPVQTAYVLLGFSSVRLADPQLYALDVLANILGDGRSSRLYEGIVRQRRLAHSIASWDYTPYDPGVFAVYFRTDPERIDAATQAILQLIDEVKQRGVTDAELRKAKRSVAAGYLFGLQTVEAKASDLASSLASTGDPLFSRQYVTGVEQVTKEQVQAVAQKFLDASKMTRAIIRPAAAAQAATAAPESAGLSMTKTALPNGAPLIVGVDQALPIAAITVAFHGGVRVETDETQGLSNLVAQLLTKGTARKSASEIAFQVESLGGHLEAFSGRDGFGIVLQVLSQDMPDGLALAQELVTQSTFSDDELTIQRQLIANQLQAQEDEVFDVGGRLLRRTLFTQHPYRFHPLGSRDTIGALSRAQCLEFAKRWIVPSNMVVSVAGDVSRETVEAKVRKLFGSGAPAPSPWPPAMPAAAPEGIHEASQVLDKEQAVIMFGFLGSAHAAPDRDALDVLTAVLSGMAGRLFQSVREQFGLSYTLGASHVPGWDRGLLLVYAATRPQEQARVLQVMQEQLQLVVEQGVTEEEVDQAKRYLIGQHRMDLQSVVGLSRQSALDELYGLGYDAWTTYESRINAITPARVHEAARHYLTLNQRAQVTVGPNGHRAP